MTAFPATAGVHVEAAEVADAAPSHAVEDVGEGDFEGGAVLEKCFLNFPVDEKIRPYIGVDLSGLLTKENTAGHLSNKISWERWERCLMGFKPSPYNAT